MNHVKRPVNDERIDFSLPRADKVAFMKAVFYRRRKSTLSGVLRELVREYIREAQ